MFDDMSKFAGSVPFEYKDIMGAATQLTGIMKGGADEVRQWMPLIADLAAVTGLGIEQTTSQVVRMYSAGAASADLFRERGVLAMLGFQSGVSVSAEETRKKLMAAWEDPASKFRGLTKELAGTWQGLLSMFSDRWFLFRSRVMEAGPFDAIKSKLADLLEKINEFVEKGDFDRWADKTARAILITASAAATLAKILVVGGLMYVGLTTTIRLTQAAATAYDLLRLRLHLAKMEAVTYNSTMVVLNTTLWGTSLAATAAAGAIGKLKIALGVLFAFYAGWKIGEWLRENFLEAQLAGIWMVRVLMKGWEQLKYSADIAFTGILGLWNTVMKFMTDTFASLLEIIATGLEGIPVIGPKLAAPLQSLADELREAASSTEPLADALARIDKKHEEAKRHIEEVTDEMAAEAVAAWNAKDAINKEADEVDRSGKIHGEASKQVKKLADTYDELVRKAKSARLELQQPEEDRSRFRLEADYAEKRKKFEEDRDKLLKAEPAKTDTQKHANWLASVELMRSQELKIDQWFLEESLSLMIEGRRRRDEQYRKDIMDIRERAGEEREERQRFADIQKDDEIRRFEAMSRVGREAALREMEDKKSQIEELNRLNEMRAKVAVGRGEMSEAEATRQHYEGLRQVVEQEKAIAEAQYIIADNDSERLAAIYRMHEAKRKLLSIDAEESIRAKELKGVWKDLSESMEKMFDNTVYGVIQGTFDIRKEFQNMVNDILRMWVRMVSKIVVQKAILGIGSLFTGGPTPLQLSGPYAGGGVVQGGFQPIPTPVPVPITILPRERGGISSGRFHPVSSRLEKDRFRSISASSTFSSEVSSRAIPIIMREKGGISGGSFRPIITHQSTPTPKSIVMSSGGENKFTHEISRSVTVLPRAEGGISRGSFHTVNNFHRTSNYALSRSATSSSVVGPVSRTKVLHPILFRETGGISKGEFQPVNVSSIEQKLLPILPRAEGGLHEGHIKTVYASPVTIKKQWEKSPILPKFADGAIIDKPTLGWIGEGQGAEAIVPLDRGRINVKVPQSSKEKLFGQGKAEAFIKLKDVVVPVLLNYQEKQREKIHEFAPGGIVRQKTLAMVGEGDVPEAVIPMVQGKVPVEVVRDRQRLVSYVQVGGKKVPVDLEMPGGSQLEKAAQFAEGGIVGLPDYRRLNTETAKAVVPLREGAIPVRVTTAQKIEINIPIHVSSEGTGGRDQNVAAEDFEKAKELSVMLNAAVEQVIIKQKRAGGLLSG
jgi:hypothetical protein